MSLHQNGIRRKIYSMRCIDEFAPKAIEILDSVFESINYIEGTNSYDIDFLFKGVGTNPTPIFI